MSRKVLDTTMESTVVVLTCEVARRGDVCNYVLYNRQDISQLLRLKMLAKCN